MKLSAIQTAQKIELAIVIRKISALHGGDDRKFLDEYIEDVTKANFRTLDKTLDYFKFLRSGSEKYLNIEEKNDVINDLCKLCGRVKPFCIHG